MICDRCHRQLKNEPTEINGKNYGPVCGRKVLRYIKSKKFPKLEEFY